MNWFAFVFSLVCFMSEPNSETFAFPNHVKRLPDLYWNTSNPIFRIDNTDHIIDVNQGRNRATFDYDQINIVCPLYASAVYNMEQFVIYAVNKDEYDTCQILSAHPRILAQCDSPLQFRVFTLSFRAFSPTPGALEFRPGKDYYFISTSSRHDLHQRVDGMCRDNNMKVMFKVADPNAVTTTTTTTITTKTSVNLLEKGLSNEEDLSGVQESSSFNEIITDASLSNGLQTVTDIDNLSDLQNLPEEEVSEDEEESKRKTERRRSITGKGKRTETIANSNKTSPRRRIIFSPPKKTKRFSTIILL